MKLLLIHAPFCTPTVMPYAVANLKSFIAKNSDINVKCLDLNAKFHKLRFGQFYARIKEQKNIDDYGSLLEAFDSASRPVYKENHENIISGKAPELLEEMSALITQEQPDVVAFSLIYNSQCFYASTLIGALTKKGISCIAGGPAANAKIRELCLCLNNELELLEHLTKIKPEHKQPAVLPDFSDFADEDYLSKEIIVPIRSSNTCFYKQCTFCTHYLPVLYLEFSLEDIRETIIKSKKKHFFFIDDMISKKRLLALAKILTPLNVIWWCQLRPTKDLLGCFPELYASGLRCIAWGVESGSQRILDIIKKGTKVEEIAAILKESSDAGIKNIAYIMFGFPGETKEEFVETIAFLKNNTEHIALVSSTIFGLQKGSTVYKNPEAYGITHIHEEKRTLLEEKITYTVLPGMQQPEARRMKGRYAKTLKKLNKVPRSFNYFKEQIILF